MNFQQSEQEVPLQDTGVAFYQIREQNSEASLPVDEEVSDKNGKSVTMDEFIASIWNTDEFQLNPPLPVYEEAENNNNVAPEPTIPQPGSFSVPPPICTKTADEVWSEIQKSQPEQNEANDSLASDETLQKDPTFGEMTLEDFLIKAGVVTESTLFTTILPQNHFANIPTNIPFNASYILIGTTGLNMPMPCGRFEPPQMLPQNNHFVVRNFTTTNVAVENNNNNNSRNVAESSSSNGKGKKRIINGPPEVVIERRQRRMLKNRESAARSRARRQIWFASYHAKSSDAFQAYTVELEAELNNLKNENEELKNMLAEDERKRLVEEIEEASECILVSSILVKKLQWQALEDEHAHCEKRK
ncbi:hypothetical protein V8G54_027273 [Vigna mungo]|uniref:BZIP domain-containing protein n=1 Tax=Vigna mungo TaxID=3915 RepID=A0AAQ3RQU7_VIGMU